MHSFKFFVQEFSKESFSRCDRTSEHPCQFFQKNRRPAATSLYQFHYRVNYYELLKIKPLSNLKKNKNLKPFRKFSENVYWRLQSDQIVRQVPTIQNTLSKLCYTFSHYYTFLLLLFSHFPCSFFSISSNHSQILYFQHIIINVKKKTGKTE